MVSLLVEINDKLGVAVGGSALAIHYENVITVIEKLLRYPHLVGEEARDDLYQMLPTRLKMSLKKFSSHLQHACQKQQSFMPPT